MAQDRVSLNLLSCETAGLQLRPLTKGDEALFHALYSDPVTMRFVGTPLTPAHAAQRFSAVIDRPLKSVVGDRLLVIEEKFVQTPLGICGMPNYDRVATRIEVGIMLLRKGRTQGIAKEAMDALVTLAFVEPLVDEVFARFTVGNAGARNLGRRMGFQPCAAAVGENATMCEWSVYRSAWLGHKAIGKHC